MHLCVQPRARDRGERALAAVRAVRRRPIGQGHTRPADEQVQGLRLRDDDQLRGGGRGYTEPERLHPGQPRAPGQLQDEQEQGGVGRATGGSGGGGCGCGRGSGRGGGSGAVPSSSPSAATYCGGGTAADADAGGSSLQQAGTWPDTGRYRW